MGEDVEAPSSPVPPPSAISNSRPDDDVEEGEILDEEGFGGGGGVIPKKKANLSGEIEAVGVADQFEKRNLVCSDLPLCDLIIFRCAYLFSVWSLRKFQMKGRRF